ncbi:MAG TPA: hypothetical protein VF070_48515, partial [Streptosporangiaceae bacterium]
MAVTGVTERVGQARHNRGLGPAGSGKTPQEWGVVVRREDGAQLYYFVHEGHVDSWGKPLEFWGRETQA